MLTFIDQNRQLNRSQLGFLLIAQALVIIPLFFFLPLWIPVVWLVSFGWRVQVFRGRSFFPNSRVKMLLGVMVIVALAASSKGTLGEETLVGLLVSSFSLKLLEIRKVSDSITLIFIGFITTATQFLFNTNFVQGLYAVVCLIFLFAGLTSIYQVDNQQVVKLLKDNGMLVLQSIPVMVIFFVMFPRVGPLWAVPNSQNDAFTGFGKTMSPGSFSNLIQSDDIAFRVTFENYKGEKNVNIPLPRQRYWRGLVLDRFDGREWTSELESRFSPSTYRASNPPGQWRAEVPNNFDGYQYSIMLEPHHYHWLFTMMLPLNAEAGLIDLEFTDEYLLRSPMPVAQRVQYHVTSSSDYVTAKSRLTQYQYHLNVMLPKKFNPKTQAMVSGWVAQGLNSSEIIDTVLGLYEKSFVYTITPPKLSRNSVDDFLFNTKKGFCEHFSSSFVYIMRAAGIPARVVVGYQGGEFSSDSRYLIVRQSDAHAWAEVWLAGNGWVRIDPTSSVSPERIENGLQSSLSDLDYLLLTGGGWLESYNSFVVKFMNNFDYLSYNWHRWVLAYSGRTQEEFLKKLIGAVSALKVTLYILAGIGLFGFLYYLSLVNFYIQPKQSYELKLYKKFQAKVLYASRGVLKRKQGETPSMFASRLVDVFPDQSTQIDLVTSLFEKAVFSEEDVSQLEFKKAVDNLTLPRLKLTLSD